jgi:hypothetical protein
LSHVRFTPESGHCCITGKSLGALLEAFTPQERANYFANAGYALE